MFSYRGYRSRAFLSQVFVVLIMLNLLISLMTTTFARIQRNSDMEWKFTRASTWVHYYDDLNAIPVPFNIFPSAHTVVKCADWIKNRGGDAAKTWTSAKLMYVRVRTHTSA